MAEPHIDKDKVITQDKVVATERLMNGHSYQFCRIFGVCTGWDDGKRVKGAMTNKNLPPPCLKICPKDHKTPVPGQPMASRPICGANNSHNGQLSHLLSLMLNELADQSDDGTECRSTEEMIAEMEEKVNNRNDITDLFVGSTDVKALYPSLLAKGTTDIIQEVFMEAEMKIDGINWSEAGKYLAINLSSNEILELGLEEVVSKRKRRGGRNPGITTAEVMGKLYREEGEETESLFNPPQRRPGEQEKKLIINQVIKIATLAVLENHNYQFGGEVRHQTDGSPIGLELAGALSRVVMLWWDKKFLKLASINEINIYFYSRYVDDGNLAGKPLAPGKRWLVGPWANALGGRMVMMEDKIQDDLEVPADARTMREIRKMGDSINQMIQLEEDFPSKSDDQKMPILDLKVWVRQVDGQSKIFYHYYRKFVSNWLLFPAMSAMSSTVKRTALTQYGLRILRNCKLELEWEEKAKMLSIFMERMRDWGYGERFRQEILVSILKGWKKMLEEQNSGRRPVNRHRRWKEEERRDSKWRKKLSWFKAGGYSTVIFCPYTPNGELASRWREIEARGAATRGWRYRVVELGGRKLKSILCKNPWDGPCTDQQCMICTTGGRGNCGRAGCTYAVQCLRCRDQGPDTVPELEEEDGDQRPGQGKVGVPCLALYHGQSGYNGFTRGLDHHSDKRRKVKTNALWRHSQLYHKSQEVSYSMTVTSTPSDPISRLCREGVSIVAGEQDILLNSKQEFLQGAVPSTRTQRGFRFYEKQQ